MRQYWNEWMTSGGNIKRASCSQVAKWVVDSWNSVKIEMVQKSFKKTGISNNLDGTENDLIWEDEESGGIDDEIQVVENVEENAISEEATVHPYDDELDDVVVDFLFEEVSEPEEMTDDDSDFNP